MKYLKFLGLAAIFAAALTAFAGTASATTLTGSGGTLPAGTEIKSVAEGKTILHPPIGDIECEESTVSGKTSNEGSATETVQGSIESLTFSKCNATVTVLVKGSLEIHTSYETVIDEVEGRKVDTRITKTVADSNGWLTGNGNEVTVEFLGFHCIFKTNGTPLGKVTGSANTGGNATLDIEATIPRTGGRSGVFCGSEAQWTGSYKVTSPSVLNID
ncbi:MAG TPA: hypothetical protein VFX44_07175 [Solirubrobacterales bacterium]|nr:hypothetical protein [Solirubrobacterales bacterium]